MTPPTAPELVHVLHLEVEVAAPLEIGAIPGGLRRVVPITGGTVSGLFSGEVLPGGSDIQLWRTPVETEVDARYVLRSDAGDLVTVHNRGLRTGSLDDMDRIRRGEPVPPERIYFRSSPVFETSAAGLQALTTRVHVATGIREPHRVLFEVFALL